jgi:phage protein D
VNRIAIPYSVRVGDPTDPSKDYVQLPQEMRARVSSLVYEDNVRKADKLTLTIDNYTFDVSDSALFRKKTPLEVTWGYAARQATPRRCRVKGMKGWTVVQVEALGEIVQLNDKTKARVFENKTRSQVVEEIAGEHGYDVVIEDTEVVYPLISQAGLTDAQFIRQLAKKEGFEFFTTRGRSLAPKKAKSKTKSKGGSLGQTIHFHSRDFSQDPMREVVWFSATQGDIITGNFDNDTEGKAGSVALLARNPDTKKDIKAEVASNETAKSTALGPSRDLYVSHMSGATNSVISQPPASSGVAVTAPTSAKTEKEANRKASAAYQNAQKSVLKLSLTLRGDPTISAGILLRVSGIGKRLSGNYYVEKSVHKLDSSGYTTTVDLHRDSHGGYGDQKKDVATKAPVNSKEPDKNAKTLRSREVDKQSGAVSESKTEIVYEPKGGGT